MAALNATMAAVDAIEATADSLPVPSHAESKETDVMSCAPEGSDLETEIAEVRARLERNEGSANPSDLSSSEGSEKT